MAEEEVLDEKPVAAKKQKGGGVTFGQLVGIGVILILVSVLGTLLVFRGVSGIQKMFSSEITGIKTDILGQQQIMGDRPTVKFCEQVYRLTEDPMIINMADGEHYISTEIAVCVDPKRIREEEFEMRIPQIRHIINDSLSRVRKDDLFGPGATQEDVDMAVELGIESPTEGAQTFAKNLNRYRGQLMKDLAANFPWLVDLYFESFLIQ